MISEKFASHRRGIKEAVYIRGEDIDFDDIGEVFPNLEVLPREAPNVKLGFRTTSIRLRWNEVVLYSRVQVLGCIITH